MKTRVSLKYFVSYCGQKKTDLNAKTTEIESKIPSVTALATNSALTAVKSNIPDVSGLVAKTDYDTRN